MGRSRRKDKRSPWCQKVGIYWPSTVGLWCKKDAWNRFNIPNDGFDPDFGAYLITGKLWHDLLEKFPAIAQSEIPCKLSIPYAKGKTVIVSGRADGITHSGIVVEFKTSLGWEVKKPKFEHQLQLNFYLKALGKDLGALVYIHADRINVFWVRYSDWHWNIFVDRVLSLHAMLSSKDVPICRCPSRGHDVIYENYLQEKKRR